MLVSQCVIGWQEFGYWFATPEGWEQNGNYRLAHICYISSNIGPSEIVYPYNWVMPICMYQYDVCVCCRSLGYMRPLSIWAMQFAINQQHKHGHQQPTKAKK